MKIKIKIVQRHSTAFKKWNESCVANATIIHIDAHSDFYGLSKKTKQDLISHRIIEKDSIYLTSEGDYDIGNYLSIVIETGIACGIVWVRQDFNPSNIKLEQTLYENFMKSGEGISEFKWCGFDKENRIATAIVNGIKWDFCSFENIEWNIYKSVVIDIDADYFMFYEEDIRNEVIKDTLKKCGEHINLQCDFIVLSISFEGGFISSDFQYNIIKLSKELDFIYDIEWVTEELIHPLLSSDFREKYNYALYLLRSGKYRESNYEFLSLVNYYNWIPGVHYNIALTYRILNKFFESEKYYKQALQINPDLYMVINDLGTLYLNEGKIIDAVILYEKEIDKYDIHSDINFNLGMAYYMQRDLERALERFKRASDLQQINYRYSYMQAITLKELGAIQKANKILCNLLELPLQDKFKKLVNNSI